MITKQLMETLFPTKGLNPQKYNLVRLRGELVEALNEFLPKYGIDSYRRVCAFLSCCGVESDYFKTTSEYASGADYEGRKNLGNTQTGDGRRFKGRGIIQTTGRYNYTRLNKQIGKRLGIDVVKNPELLNDIRVAVESACVFWQDNNLNKYADAKRIKELNGIVNRGNPEKMPLHWEKRNSLYSLCIRRIPQNFKFETEEENSATEYQPLGIASAAVVSNVTPANASPDETGLAFDMDKVEASYSSASATLQRPALKRVITRLFYKIVGGLGFVWGSTSGKIALVLSVAVILVAIGGVCYSYRNQIRLGFQIAKNSVIKTLKNQTA